MARLRPSGGEGGGQDPPAGDRRARRGAGPRARSALPRSGRGLAETTSSSERGLVALDALLRLGTGDVPAQPGRPLARIRNLLEPRSVAIVGVSEKTNPGRIILRNMLREGFDPGCLHVVKPGGKEIDGCRCWPDLSSLPGRMDLVVLAIDAGQIPDTFEEILTHQKAESLVLIPGGLGETKGSSGQAERLRSALGRARASEGGGPVVNGGNCLGIRSVPGRTNTLFIPEPKLRFPREESTPLALLSQSGAFASRLARLFHTTTKLTTRWRGCWRRERCRCSGRRTGPWGCWGDGLAHPRLFQLFPGFLRY